MPGTNRTLLRICWAPLPRWVPELVLITSAVFTVQCVLGAYRRDLANDPDEPAHFVTGVMVYDYFTSALGSPPVAFAEEYYLHYPKVAIGHWPPGLYLLQSVWYLCAGVSRGSATVLSAVFASATVFCLFRRLFCRNGLPIALLTIAVFAGQPLVRAHSILIMSDMACCLFSLLAVFAFSDFLETHKSGRAAAFAVWSVIAILIKPAALALALFVPVCAIVARRTALLRNRQLLYSGACIAALAAPYYLWTWSKGLGLHGRADVSELVMAAVPNDHEFHALGDWSAAASVWVAAIAIIGCIPLFRRLDPAAAARAGAMDAGAALAWCGATCVLLYLAPVYSEPRYFLPVLAGLLILYADGLCLVLRGLGRLRPAGWVAVAGLAALSVLTAPGHDLEPVAGYAAAAEKIPDSGPGRVMLVSSSATVEGVFVAERLLRDRSRSEYVLRASKVLATSGWSGANYRPRFKTSDQIREFLDSIPVHFVVIDDFDYRAVSPPAHHELLKKLMAEAPEQFSPVGTFPVLFQGHRHDGVIRVYENRNARGRLPGGLELDMSERLGRKLRQKTGPGDVKQTDH
jgi:hypothetical protein